MSRRQRTILTVSLRIPQPPGKSQHETVEEIRRLFNSSPTFLSLQEVIAKVVAKETTYL